MPSLLSKLIARMGTWQAATPLILALLVMVPVLTIMAHWLFGDFGLYAVGLGMPLVIAGLSLVIWQNDQIVEPESTFEMQRAKLETAADRTLLRAQSSSRTTACVMIAIDDFRPLRDRLGMNGVDQIQRQVTERLLVSLRREDTVGAFSDGVFGVVLHPIANADLEALLQISGRLQRVIADPMIVAGSQVTLTASIGFCQPDRLPEPSGAALLEAAENALLDATAQGPGSVRAYTVEMHRRRTAAMQMAEDLRDALELGQIVPWFQPQISTDTGQVTGFEALARWTHPERGMVSPGEFLPVLERAGLIERLGEVILFHSLTALKAWGRAGLHVPSIGINFSPEELRNPALVDKITWELDRFELSPDRLTVEVLESVMSSGTGDVISHNITALANLGCKIDLDDFGTGHASITNIRRFAVSRLKIDRSFVTRVHEDREQQRMVAAILTMAERLDLETLGEGVESVGEHTMMAQLGCGHVQGFGIARPMPFGDTIAWLRDHNSKLVHPPVIGRQSGTG